MDSSSSANVARCGGLALRPFARLLRLSLLRSLLGHCAVAALQCCALLHSSSSRVGVASCSDAEYC